MSGNDWYYERDGQRVGPFRPEELGRMVSAGILPADTRIHGPDNGRLAAGQLMALGFLPRDPQGASVAEQMPVDSTATDTEDVPPQPPPPPPPPPPVAKPAPNPPKPSPKDESTWAGFAREIPKVGGGMLVLALVKYFLKKKSADNPKGKMP